MSSADMAIAPSEADIHRLIQDNGDVAAWTHATASQNGLGDTPEAIDSFADTVSRLSDDEVRLDTTERLLLALERAGLVTAQSGVLLHAAYLRQIP